MIIFCSPHNPTGNVWAKEDLQRLAALCKSTILCWSAMKFTWTLIPIIVIRPCWKRIRPLRISSFSAPLHPRHSTWLVCRIPT
ncbi:aminotransferase class I/II-fold pyridoxal phosphate-dependent enzyme [Allobaculum sp. Allo2]|nr:aminotransferase class I/II-fold pyridoxal phosphate-dependent enzyme [Allobaculum sp. Allo2]